MDCAVTEQCGAANFKTEFTVSVEFWAADSVSLHCKNFCQKATYVSRLKALEGRPVNSKKNLQGFEFRKERMCLG